VSLGIRDRDTSRHTALLAFTAWWLAPCSPVSALIEQQGVPESTTPSATHGMVC
jgi:hypothetical protein